MKKLIVLAVAAMFATSAAHAADMKWNGSAGWRYSQTSYDDGLNSAVAAQNVSKQVKKDHAMRANLGVTGGSSNTEYGAAVSTSSGAANSDYANVNQATDPGIGLSEAWFKYSYDFGTVDFSAIFGRQNNVFAYDASQQLFDNDVHFDGFAQRFTMGSFGLNVAEYILGARTTTAGTVNASSFTQTDATQSGVNNRKFMSLVGFQPHMKWKFTDEISTMFAVGYYLWAYDGATNRDHGGYNSNTLNGTTGVPANSNVTSVHNPKQWQFYNTWDLPFKLAASWEYVINKKFNYGTTVVNATNQEVDHKAFSIGLSYGKVRKAHDWAVGYAYGSKGIGSVINTFSNDKFLADNKGHTVWAKYAIDNNFNIGWKGYFLKEKSNKNASTGLSETGANVSQSQKTNYWELTAGVNF